MKPVRPIAAKPPECIEFVPKGELDRGQPENDGLHKKNERLKQEAERLRRELEATLRAAKRLAAPHSRGNLNANPKRPGRKPSCHYGRQACRRISSHVDEQIAVPLPERCPDCGAESVERECCETQYQQKIVRRAVARRFDIAVGRCRQCQRRVRGRHRLQTSDAVGVGNVHLGQEALTLAAIFNK